MIGLIQNMACRLWMLERSSHHFPPLITKAARARLSASDAKSLERKTQVEPINKGLGTTQNPLKGIEIGPLVIRL